jgi:hypothetical protein
MATPEDDLFVQILEGIESSDGLTDEDKDLLRKLARKVEEIEREARNSN